MKHHHKPLRAALGFSIVELLVAMGIGLVLTLAIFSVLARGEGTKRNLTSVNDVNQTGAYVSYALDRIVRSAGSGYAGETRRWAVDDESIGCNIVAARDGTALLPRAAAMPAPFATLPLAARLAPLIIHKSASAAGSDVLAVMTGTSGHGETAPRVKPLSVGTAEMRLQTNLGFRANDLVLLVEEDVGCMLQQVASTLAAPHGGARTDLETLPLAGPYYRDTSATVNLTQFATSGTAFAISLGNADTNPPQFQVLGVGEDNTLFSYDMLRTGDSDDAVPIADGVVELRALYGIDNNNDNLRQRTEWVDPGVAPYDAASLLNGSLVAKANLRRIVAVRIGLILRTPLVEREAVAPEEITLFGDLDESLQHTRTLDADERLMRHRAVEVTIPLRNLLLLPGV
jgi:type IV pilus assembly protein PilW